MPDFLSSLKFVVGSVSPLICGSRCDYLDRFVWFRVIVARLTGRWTASGTTGIRRTGTGARTARNAIVSIFPRSRFMIFRWVSSFIMVSGPWSMAIILMSMMISVSRFRMVTYFDWIFWKIVFCRMNVCEGISLVIRKRRFFVISFFIFFWNILILYMLGMFKI